MDFYEIRQVIETVKKQDPNDLILNEKVSKRDIEKARQQSAKEVQDVVDNRSYLDDYEQIASDFIEDAGRVAGRNAAKKMSDQFAQQLRGYIQDVAKNPRKYSRR